MSNVPTAQNPILRAAHGEINLSIAERLAEVLDRRPRRKLFSRLLLAVTAALAKVVVASIVCVTASIAICAVGLRRSAGIDLFELISKKVAANTPARARESEHDAIATPRQHPVRPSPRQPPLLPQHVANREAEHRDALSIFGP